MPKKPSELINGPAIEPQPSQPQPSVQPAQPTTSTNRPSVLATLVVMLLAGWLVYMIANRIDWGGDRKEDHHGQDDKKHDKVVIKPGYLHIVRERIDTVEATESVARIAEFAKKQTDVQWRDSDKDDTSDAVVKMIAHAKSKGVDPPFLLFKSKEDNQLRGVIKLPPANATDTQIMEVFK